MARMKGSSGPRDFGRKHSTTRLGAQIKRRRLDKLEASNRSCVTMSLQWVGWALRR
jgi:hypothetical protein